MRALARSLLFPRHWLRADPDAGHGIPGLERCWLDVPQGRIEAWFLPGDGVDATEPGPLVIFAHGNGELIEHWPAALAGYRRRGASVLLPEFRGYGRSDGQPSEASIVSDFVRWYDAFTTRADVDPSRIVLHGRSLGGGVVCGLLERRCAAALVVESTFTSIVDVAAQWFVPSALIADRFDNLRVVRSRDVPTLVIHGRWDSLIPVEHAKRLAAGAKRGRLWLFDGDHNDPPPPTAYWEQLSSVLEGLAAENRSICRSTVGSDETTR